MDMGFMGESARLLRGGFVKRGASESKGDSVLHLPEGYTTAPLLHERSLGPVPQVRILYDHCRPAKREKPSSRSLDGR